jgi:hypothetical protein
MTGAIAGEQAATTKLRKVKKAVILFMVPPYRNGQTSAGT